MNKKISKDEYKTMLFETQKDFRDWLKKNHKTVPGVWLKFYKKGSGKKSIVYAEAMDEVLCFGWIDSQSKGLDEKSYLQKFTPRRSKSMWSKINQDKVARLIKEEKMTAAGLAEIERAKQDGRWDVAHDSPKNMVTSPDFIKMLSKNKKAKEFFETLNKSNLYAINWRLQTAKKPETKTKRMELILKMLERGEKFH